jgi:release factor glutamine methyltransferase
VSSEDYAPAMLLTERARRSPAMTRLLFGVDAPGATGQAHWDLTTLVLRSALDRLATPGVRMLEMGCGEVGVLSIHAARRHAATVLAADVSADAVVAARQSFARNDVAVETRVSDLFGAIRPDEVFDLIVFNPPYVPTSSGAARHLAEPPRVWDGGADGADVIRRFLAEARGRLAPRTRVLLGFNARHVGEGVVAAEVASRRLALLGRVARWWSPSVVFVIGPAPD